MSIFLLTFLFTLSVGAQHSEQPIQENNSDIRVFNVLFSLEDVPQKKTLRLERTPNLEHYLRFKDKKGEQVRKIDSREAKKYEMDFASRFIRCQYELPTRDGECQIHYRLSLMGEDQDICSKDEKKSQEMDPFKELLEKRFW